MRESEKGCGCYDGGGIESVAAVVEAEGDQAKQMMCCELCRPRCPSRPPCCSQLEAGLIFLPSPPLSPSFPFPHSLLGFVWCQLWAVFSSFPYPQLSCSRPSYRCNIIAQVFTGAGRPFAS